MNLNLRLKAYALLLVLVTSAAAIYSGALHAPNRTVEWCDPKPRKVMLDCQIKALNQRATGAKHE
jgi:hypothetical protein